MSMLKRIKVLEQAMTALKPGQRVWLDHEPTHEILGVSWCEGEDRKHLDYLPGESVEAFKKRCIHEAMRYPGGLVFVVEYGKGRVPSRCEGPYPCHILEVDNELT